MRLIATVEDPDAIRAILAALAMSRERADRAPPFAASLVPSHAAAISAERHPEAAFAEPCSLVSWGRFPSHSSALRRNPLTGWLSGLYPGAGGAREPALGGR